MIQMSFAIASDPKAIPLFGKWCRDPVRKLLGHLVANTASTAEHPLLELDSALPNIHQSPIDDDEILIRTTGDDSEYCSVSEVDDQFKLRCSDKSTMDWIERTIKTHAIFFIEGFLVERRPAVPRVSGSSDVGPAVSSDGETRGMIYEERVMLVLFRKVIERGGEVVLRQAKRYITLDLNGDDVEIGEAGEFVSPLIDYDSESDGGDIVDDYMDVELEVDESGNLTTS